MSDEDNKTSKKRSSTSAEHEPPTKKKADSSDSDTDWDVEECRGDHESVEHWELRKQFLLQNMGRFPKSRMICLSQVFANMEFLGCRYPEATMEQVQELSMGIVEEYREKQKSRLQRTFVKASAAAERKTKGNNFGKPTINASNKGTKPIKFLPATSASSSNFRSNQNGHRESRSHQYPDLENMILLIYTYNTGENAISIIHRSCSAVNVPIVAEYGGTLEHYSCTYRIGSHLTVHSKDGHPSKESAKLEAAKLAFQILQKFCYTFVTKMKTLPDSQGKEIGKDDVDNGESSSSSTQPISGDNIGNKLLKLMGWSGGGLGKNQQGIHEAISVDGVVGRSRLGLGNAAGGSFNRKISDLLEEHKNNGFPYDLKFSSDFSKDERKEIHIIAQRLGLKSKSFGKDEDRYIVVSEKVSRKGLLQNTLAEGGETDKYCVIPPAGDINKIKEFI